MVEANPEPAAAAEGGETEQMINTGAVEQEEGNFQDIIEGKYCANRFLFYQKISNGFELCVGGDLLIDGEEGDEQDFEMANHGTGNEDDDYFD